MDSSFNHLNFLFLPYDNEKLEENLQKIGYY
nr:MAG TPA: hypothetical protein [Caudoviricetes sp.]